MFCSHEKDIWRGETGEFCEDGYRLKFYIDMKLKCFVFSAGWNSVIEGLH